MARKAPTAEDYEAAIEAWNLAHARVDVAAMAAADRVIRAYDRARAKRSPEMAYERRNG